MPTRAPASPATPCVIVAALSARWLAEAGQRDGFQVLALDAFGDADTQAAAAACWPVGDDAAQVPALSGARLRAGLAAARQHAVRQAWDLWGWVPGPGCEPLLEALQASGTGEIEALPELCGNSDAVWRHTREPSRFFALLDRHGLPHPPTRSSPPLRREGWLRKDLSLSGGWGVTPAQADGRDASPSDGSAPAQAPRICWQADLPGEPWSLLFLAGAQGLRVLGTQRQHTRAVGHRPYVFAGLTGPLPAPEGLQEAWAAAALTLTLSLGLRGLCSLDLVVDPACGEWHIVELNPRPSASLQLYPHWPLLRWHLQACREGWLPGSDDLGAARSTTQAWRVVFAPQPLAVSPGALHEWGGPPHEVRLHDLPAAGSALALPAGAPLCSLSTVSSAPLATSGAQSAQHLQARLAQAEDRLMSTCTTLSP